MSGEQEPFIRQGNGYVRCYESLDDFFPSRKSEGLQKIEDVESDEVAEMLGPSMSEYLDSRHTTLIEHNRAVEELKSNNSV